MSGPTVADVMTRDVVSVLPTTSFADVVRLLASKGISAVPVLGEGAKLLGVVSEADLLVKERQREEQQRPGFLALPAVRRRFRKAQATTAGEVMTTAVRTIRPDASLTVAAQELLDGGIRRLFVVDDQDVLVGVLARRDVLRVFTRSNEELVEIIRRDVVHDALWASPKEVIVSAADGEVTLVGRVDRRSDAEWAGRLTAQTPGVVVVHNQLTFIYDDVAARA